MNKKMTQCPYCGSEEYFIKQQASGRMLWRMRFDGEEADNATYYESLNVENESDYAWCSKCGKRLFKLGPEGKE